MKNKDYSSFDKFANGGIGIYNWYDTIHSNAIFIGNHKKLNFGQTGICYKTDRGYYFFPDNLDVAVIGKDWVYHVNKTDIKWCNPPTFN